MLVSYRPLATQKKSTSPRLNPAQDKYHLHCRIGCFRASLLRTLHRYATRTPSMRALAALLLIAAAKADDVDNENATAASSLNDVVEGLKDQIFADHVKGAPQTFREECAAFIAAVDWRETWIRCLLLWHLSLWLLFVFTRKNFPVQCGLFFGIAACVALAETLNGLCAKRWEKFATQNYFDERGVFAGIMLCAPLLALAFAMLLNFLVMASSMLVTVKRAEFRGKARELGAQAEAEAQAVPAPSCAHFEVTERRGGRSRTAPGL